MKSLIIEGMTPITYMNEDRIECNAKRIKEAGLKILDEVIVTASMALFVIDYPTGPASWAFYPNSGCEDYIASIGKSEDVRSFTDRSVDQLLRRHNWLNKDVETLINSRKGKE